MKISYRDLGSSRFMAIGGDAPIHAAHKCLLEKVAEPREPRRDYRPILVLQLRPRARDTTRDDCNGSWGFGSCVERRRNRRFIGGGMSNGEQKTCPTDGCGETL